MKGGKRGVEVVREGIMEEFTEKGLTMRGTRRLGAWLRFQTAMWSLQVIV